MWLPKPLPWIPPDHDDATVYAIRAVAEGLANDSQQKLFWRYLMYVTKASDEFQDLSFRPSGEKAGARGEATDFAEGMRFVGMMIRKLLRPEFTPKSQDAEPATKSVQQRLRDRRQ